MLFLALVLINLPQIFLKSQSWTFLAKSETVLLFCKVKSKIILNDYKYILQTQVIILWIPAVVLILELKINRRIFLFYLCHLFQEKALETAHMYIYNKYFLNRVLDFLKSVKR